MVNTQVYNLVDTRANPQAVRAWTLKMNKGLVFRTSYIQADKVVYLQADKVVYLQAEKVIENWDHPKAVGS